MNDLVVCGILYCDIKTAEDIQAAVDSYAVNHRDELPITRIEAAKNLSLTLKDMDRVNGIKVIFDHEIPSGHIFLVMGQPEPEEEE